MNTQENPLLSDVHKALIKTINSLDNTSLEAAFVTWVCPKLRVSINAQLSSNSSLMDYRFVAQLGLLCKTDPNLIKNNQDNLINGIRRMIGRPTTIIGGSTAPFTTDIIALIGIAEGAKIIGGELQTETSEWMLSFVEESCKNLPLWKRCIAFSALQIIGSKRPILLPILGNASTVRVALYQSGIKQILQEGDDESILIDLYKSVFEESEMDACLAGLHFCALQYVIDAAPTVSLSRPTVPDLIHFLERIPAAFRRWTWEEKAKTPTSTIQTWDIQNEYHVQNLLYLLLSPIFPDLEDEFYFEPVGQKNARADLGIPSMNLIIEVKFLRSGVRFANMVEEVAADNSLYFGAKSEYASKYQKLLAFVWDDSRRDIEHDVFKRGVNQLSHVVASVVISRPGNMPHRKEV